MNINNESLIVLIILLFLFFYLKNRSYNITTPHFLFSNLNKFETKTKKRNFTKFFLLWTLLFFTLAFIDPHIKVPIKAPEEPPKEGIAIYLDLDQSGSMKEIVHKIPKIDLLKKVTKEFISNRPNDLIGLISFARIPQVVSPLTLDHSFLQQRLEELQTVSTKEQDGTAIGYAIYKTAHMIAAMRHFANDPSNYQIKSYIMVVLTDGKQDPSPLDEGNRLRTIGLEEAAEYAKKENIRLYIINIDPNFASEEYAPHRRQMEQVATLTGGRFFLSGDQQNLTQIFQTINSLEKSYIPVQEQFKEPLFAKISFFPILILLGLATFFCASLFNFGMRRVLP